MSPRRPSPAFVVAVLALVVALGGVSYAAVQLPKNSVGTKQLKKNAVSARKIKLDAVTGPKIRLDAVTGPKVRADSLTGADVLESTLVAPGGTVRYAGFDFKPMRSSYSYQISASGAIYPISSNTPSAYLLTLALPKAPTSRM